MTIKEAIENAAVNSVEAQKLLRDAELREDARKRKEQQRRWWAWRNSQTAKQS